MIQASNLPCALCKILIEEKVNKNLVRETLDIISNIFDHIFIDNSVSLKWDFMDCFVQFGICEVLISYIGEYMNNGSNDCSMSFILRIIQQLTSAQFTDDDTMSRFVAAGLLNCLVTVYKLYSIRLNSSGWYSLEPPLHEFFFKVAFIHQFNPPLLGIVSNLCEFDVHFIHQFNLLGIPRDSFFFSNLPPGPEDLA